MDKTDNNSLNDDESMRSVDSKANENKTEEPVSRKSFISQSSLLPINDICESCHTTRVKDVDLHIRSLYESIEIHKELVEQSQKEREEALVLYEEAQQTIKKLQSYNEQLLYELQAKKQEYKKMEANFYSHVGVIRATDDDLSTIQPEIGHIMNQISNFCLGLRSKMDSEAGRVFVFSRWPERVNRIQELRMKNSSNQDQDKEQLEPAFITLFVEKYIIDTLIKHILLQPIQIGVSINDAYQQLEKWMMARHPSWATRFRQQINALIAKQPKEEEQVMKSAQDELVKDILETLSPIYPSIKENGMSTEKKVIALVQRVCKLSTAIKGQEIEIFPLMTIEEGITLFDAQLMKAASKSRSEGTVELVISPPFITNHMIDHKDDDREEEEGHGFIVQGKVYCI
ncbi:hypothetical protein BJ944DRAFT_258391 [Cunninghamella echinulata]|nr:hypothetical protein BJ944DRAFT_258391 [Cunninghamella echinulata]